MNKLLKCLAFDNQISVSLLDTTELVQKAIEIHGLSPVCSLAFGKVITATTFMACGLKNASDKLTVTIKGNGPCGKITACGKGNLEMCGSIDNPRVSFPIASGERFNVGKCVGQDGKLVVIKSMGLKGMYSSDSALVNGEIADDFVSYYALSEQTPTYMALDVLLDKNFSCLRAGGLIVQPLPFAENKNVTKAKKLLEKLTNIATFIKDKGAENVLKEYFNACEFSVFYPVYKCQCNREYIEKILISLGKKELKDIIKEQGKIEVKCQFCNTDYVFNEEDIKNLF